MSYGVVRTDNMYATDVRAGLVSIQYLGSGGGTPTAIENGNVLKVGALKEDEREVYVGGDVAANDKLTDVVLVASPEVMYDERKHNLDEFINEAGKNCRGYRLHSGDIFSVTADALTFATSAETDGKVGSTVELAAGTKLNVKTDGATPDSTVVGKVIAVDVVGRYTYYVIKVD